MYTTNLVMIVYNAYGQHETSTRYVLIYILVVFKRKVKSVCNFFAIKPLNDNHDNVLS